ncbi:MAG: NAD(P) transhydrogenase subunit alpha [Alphaproteobacteria bacterium]|nr:NAD(P) transhydrogenase subunit alpha [Alphaproteobacteria bacterium]
MLKHSAVLIGASLLLSPLAHASGAGEAAADPLIFRLAIFVLAVFVGYYVVWSVTPALHTPLMAVTNAISSVIIVGALVAAAAGADAELTPELIASKSFGGVAVLLAAVNIFGGFLVTSRMLAMYKKKDRAPAKSPSVKS